MQKFYSEHAWNLIYVAAVIMAALCYLAFVLTPYLICFIGLALLFE